LSATAQSLADLNDRIERANALRTKRSWAGLLSLVAQCLPQEVWLTSVATDAPPPAAARRRTSPRASEKQDHPTVVVLDGARRAALAGYALGHEQLYDFMARLKAAQAFDRIDLVKADKEDVLWARAVRFELLCTW
jgi:Tfp pilus assembly protein PilN